MDNHILAFSKSVASGTLLQAADLKGKKIGYVPAISSHVFLYRFLKDNGISWGEITPVPLQIQAMLPALRGGMVDAVSIWEPWGTRVQNELKDQIASFRSRPSLYPSRSYLATRNKILKEKPAQLEKLLIALSLAKNYLDTNTEESFSLVAKDLGVTPEMMPIVNRDHHYDISSGESSVELLNQIGRWIIETQEEIRVPPAKRVVC